MCSVLGRMGVFGLSEVDSKPITAIECSLDRRSWPNEEVFWLPYPDGWRGAVLSHEMLSHGRLRTTLGV